MIYPDALREIFELRQSAVDAGQRLCDRCTLSPLHSDQRVDLVEMPLAQRGNERDAMLDDDDVKPD